MLPTEYSPPTRDRTRDNTPPAVNQRIDRETRGTLDELATPEAIRTRIAELDSEWHVDRALMAVFSVLGSYTATRTMLSIARRGRLGFWGGLLFTQIGFLGYHAVKGWCPPVSVLRRLGVRTAQEISAERAALERMLLAR